MINPRTPAALARRLDSDRLIALREPSGLSDRVGAKAVQLLLGKDPVLCRDPYEYQVNYPGTP